MNRWKWTGVVVLSLFVLYCVAGFFIAPSQLKKQLISQAKEQAGVDLSVEKVKVNPLVLSVTLEKLATQDREGRDLIAADRIYVNAQLWPLIQRNITLKSLVLEKPDVNVILTAAGDPHWLELVPATEDPEPAAAEESEPWIFTLAQTDVIDGKIRYADEPHPEAYTTELGGLNFSLSGLTTQVGEPGPFSIAFAHEGQGEVRLEGAFALSPLKFDGALTVSELQLKPSWRYARYLHGIEWESGTLNGSLDINVDGADGLELATSNGSWSLADMDMTLEDGQSLFQLASLTVEGPDVSLAERSAVISSIALNDGTINLTRGPDGELMLPAALIGGESAEPEEAEASSQDPAGESGEAFQFAIKSVTVNNLPFNWTDQSVQPETVQTLTINELSVSEFDLSPGTQFPVKLNAALGGGQILWEGQHVLTPLSVDGGLTLNELPLPWLTGYVRESAAVNVESGALGAQLNVTLSEGLKAGGSVEVSNLATSSEEGPLAGFASFSLDGIDVNVPEDEPALVHFDRVSLSEPSATFAIAADGSSNISRLIGPLDETEAEEAEPQTEPVATAEEAPGPVIELGELTIDGGTLRFADASVQPAFSASINQFGGTLKGLNSNVDKPASLDFAGKLEGYADIGITGELNPLEDRNKVTLSTKNIDLTSANAYAGKYVGRLIERGRLDLELGYELDGDSLKGSNEVVLGQLTLGGSVDSEDAVSLPLDLALALLKDPSGNIDLGVPVAGNLNDPKFRIGSVVFKAFVNLIVKAAASPFFILGKLIPGGGEDLQYVNFQPGFGELNEEATDRLAKLSEALLQRPTLRLDIAGVASRGLDAPALKAQRLETELGLAGLEDEARNTALIEAFQARIGELPTLPPEEEGAEPLPNLAAVEEQLLASLEISDDALRELATARASAIKSALAASDESLIQRAYVLEPRLVELSGGETVVVELVLAPN
ncbi:MAG: DUF748 domain-containing protein [Pseudomonadota bacterium]